MATEAEYNAFGDKNIVLFLFIVSLSLLYRSVEKLTGKWREYERQQGQTMTQAKFKLRTLLW